jgi:hypothetical protein
MGNDSKTTGAADMIAAATRIGAVVPTAEVPGGRAIAARPNAATATAEPKCLARFLD